MKSITSLKYELTLTFRLKLINKAKNVMEITDLGYRFRVTHMLITRFIDKKVDVATKKNSLLCRNSNNYFR